MNFTALRLENIALRLLREFREPAAPAPGDGLPETCEEPKPQAGPTEPAPPPQQAEDAPGAEAAPGAAPEEPGHEFGDWAGSGFEASASSAQTEDSPAGEDERLHADAKRFARLLVSEIKLYNETHVTEGRQNQDLYLRLKRDIDRSREMYEKRVSPTVADRIDYFHDEIVRILGDNDPSTLGSDYPGPRIES